MTLIRIHLKKYLNSDRVILTVYSDDSSSRLIDGCSVEEEEEERDLRISITFSRVLSIFSTFLARPRIRSCNKTGCKSGGKMHVTCTKHDFNYTPLQQWLVTLSSSSELVICAVSLLLFGDGSRGMVSLCAAFALNKMSFSFESSASLFFFDDSFSGPRVFPVTSFGVKLVLSANLGGAFSFY